MLSSAFRISRLSEESILKYTFTPAQFNRNNKNPVIGKRFIAESLVSRSAGQGERRLWERDWWVHRVHGESGESAKPSVERI